MTDYWLPWWWNWMSDWGDCVTCMEWFGTPCASCEIPPGLLAMAQLVGGGTATVAGNCRGNQSIASARQLRAAGRMPDAGRLRVNDQPVGRVTDMDVTIQSATDLSATVPSHADIQAARRAEQRKQGKRR